MRTFCRFEIQKILALISLSVLVACSQNGSNNSASETNPEGEDLQAAAVTPTVTVSINGGASYTNSTSVLLTMSATGNPSSMYITNTPGCTTGGTTKSYSNSAAWTLATPNALNTVYVKVTKGGNSSSCVSASITHDNIAPTAGTMTINSGAPSTNSTSVTLSLPATGSPSQMYITQTAGCTSGGTWQPYASSQAWTLANANALNTVYVMYRDLALNNSSCISDSIIHDNIAPTLTVTTPANGSYVTSSNAGAFSISGTCSENGLPVVISGSASTSVTCSSNAWSTSLNLSALADGALSLSVNHMDSAGNSATTVTRSLTKDTVAPSSPSISINGGAPYTASTSVSLALSAVGANQMYVTQTAGCSAGGIWEAFSTSKTWTLNTPNSTNTLYVIYRDAAFNTSSCVSASITHDNSAPTLSVTSPANGSYVNLSNVSAFTISGACSENGRSVSIAGSATATATCTSGTWSSTLNLSGLSDGTLNFSLNHTDAAGNSAPTVNLSFAKDTQAPTASGLSINSGANYTTSASVSLSLTATGANEMYITQTAGCSSGGVWETYSASKSWTLANLNSSNTVYAKFRDAAFNSSPCISASITHDDTIPTVTVTSPIEGSYINASSAGLYTVSGTCSENGQAVVISGSVFATVTCVSNSWSANLNFSALPDGAVALSVHHSDAAGNSALPVARNLTKDVVAPTPVSFAINNGDSFTTTLNVSLSISATGASQMYLTSTAACASDGVWEAYAATKSWTLVNTESLNTVYIKYKDDAGNESPCSSASITHDPPPTLAFSSPADGSYINLSNQSAFTVTGTCAPSGRNVLISGAITASAPCTNGAWSSALDLSSLADGSVQIFAAYINAAGASAPQVSHTFTKATSAPVLSTLDISGTWNVSHTVYFTNQTDVTLTIFSSGATEMYVTDDPLCLSGGNWEPYATSKPWTLPNPNQLNTVYALFRNAAGNFSACVSGSVLHDNIAPTMSVIAPLDGALVTAANKLAFTLTGTCSDEGRTVYITGPLNSTAVCYQGAWTRNLNVSSIPDGTYVLNFDIDDGRGNAAPRISRTFIKDTQGPTSPTIAINNGDATTRSTSVTLSLSAVGATEMYITADRTCNTLGTWEPYSTSKDWILPAKNRSLGVYVKFRNTNLNPSACVGATIIEDEMVPYWVTLPTHATAMNSLTDSPLVNYTENAIDTVSGVNKYYYGIGTSNQINDIKDWTEVSGGTFTVTGLSLTNKVKYYVNMKVTDKAGNERLVSSTGWLADISAPNISITSPGQNENVTEVDQKISGSCELGNTITVSYGSGLSGPASFPCTSATYSLFVDVTGGSGPRSLDVTATNAFGKSSSAHLDFNFNKVFEVKGQILAMARASDGSIFYGGDFMGYTNVHDPGAVRISTAGVKDTGFDIKSGFNGNVFAAAELPDGNLIFGGDFTKYRGRIANRIAKVDRYGNLDLTFNPQVGPNGTNATVRALVVSGGSIYAAGDFTGMKSKVAYRIAKIDFDGNLDLTFNPPTGSNVVNNIIRAVTISGGSVYIGGDFTQYRGFTANRIAKVDALTGALDSNFDSTGANASVYALTVNGGALYLGGTFTTYQGSSAKAIAKVDSSTGALDTAFSSPADNGFTSATPAVYGLAAYGSDILAVGKFTAYRGAPANYLARITASGDLDTNFNPSTGGNGFNAGASSILVIGTDIYVGGQFSNYRGAPANHLAKLSSTGNLDSAFNPSSGAASAGVDGSVNALISSSFGGLYVAGSFTSYRPMYLARNILKTDASGNIDTSFNQQVGSNGFNGVVRALAINGTDLYVGGDFTFYGNSPANRLAKLDLSGNLDTAFNPSDTTQNGANGVVRALAVNGTDLFVGGDFTRYRNQIANRIAKLDAGSGDLDLTFNPAKGYNGFNGSVYALAVLGNSVYAGGTFTYYKMDVVNRIAKLDTSTGLFDSNFSAALPSIGADGAILSIATNGADLYLGGAFLNYRGTSVNRLAKIAADGSLDTNFSPAGGGTNSTVYAMTTAGSSLIFTGVGTTYRGSVINRIGKVDLLTGALDTTFSPATGANGLGGYQPQTLLLIPIGSALLYDGSKLTVGGGFTQYRGHSFNYKISVDMTGAFAP